MCGICGELHQEFGMLREVTGFCQIVGKKRNIQYQGITIEFSKISDHLFFGFIKHDNYYLATPEKAILDTLYYRRMIPAFDELDLDDVDYETLGKMAAKFPSTISRAVHLFSLR